MSVITRLAEEVINMSDLAQAIVSLGRISERRRGARSDLVEATDTIAKAIREQLRTGDEVEVERQPQGVLEGIVYGPPTVTYRATRVTWANATTMKPIDALSRAFDGKVSLFGIDEREQSSSGFLTDEHVGAHIANEDERQAFVYEASSVVGAFRRLLEQQAGKYEAAAKKAAKLTPR